MHLDVGSFHHVIIQLFIKEPLGLGHVAVDLLVELFSRGWRGLPPLAATPPPPAPPPPALPPPVPVSEAAPARNASVQEPAPPPPEPSPPSDKTKHVMREYVYNEEV